MGLSDGHFVVDVGCGSGRLPSALQRRVSIDYLGTDILPLALRYARKHAPAHYRFVTVEGLEIPAPSDSANFVALFSLATHLQHHETYIYLQEARRVAKPGGSIVVSFLELTHPEHWQVFETTVEARRGNHPIQLNAFIEADIFRTWADRLKLDLVAVHRGGTPWVPLTERLTKEDGSLVSGHSDLGQSVAILRKPEA